MEPLDFFSSDSYASPGVTAVVGFHGPRYDNANQHDKQLVAPYAQGQLTAHKCKTLEYSLDLFPCYKPNVLISHAHSIGKSHM